MNQKINYHLLMEKEIEKIKNLSYVPTLLLHSCCAPCASYVLEFLSDYFKITIFYYNPNITSCEEYQKRALEQQEFINKINEKSKHKIKFLEGRYEVEDFYSEIKGLENTREGGERCFKCYKLRLLETGNVAKTKKFDYFSTVLSISPLKNSKKINEIGEKLQEKLGVLFLNGDFKKKNGYKRSIEISHKYNLYRQDYCGCIYSKKEERI